MGSIPEPVRVLRRLSGRVQIPEPRMETTRTDDSDLIRAWTDLGSAAKRRFEDDPYRFADYYDGLPAAEREAYEKNSNIFFPMLVRLTIQRIGRFTTYRYSWSRNTESENMSGRIESTLDIHFPPGLPAPKMRARADGCVHRVRLMQMAFESDYPLQVTLWHLDLPKILGDPVRINSGYTTFSDPSGKADLRRIVIYRREELLKVLTHELIHALGIDGNRNDPDLSRRLAGRFCLCGRDTDMLRPEEAYTDTWAITINTLLLEPDRDLREERDHMARQAAAILVWYGFRSIEDFEREKAKQGNDKGRTDMKRKEGSRCLPQITSLLSYYVLKSALYWNLDLFLRAFPKAWIDHPRYSEVCMQALANPEWRRAVRNEAAGMTRDRLRGRSMRMSVILS